MDWSIQDIARLAGTTSRTLRHYGELGLLIPSRIGGNGYRYYHADALARLQRILLLRELGLGLPAIGEVLAGQCGDADALLTHLRWLQQEKERLDRQIRAVETTIRKTERAEQLMAEEMLDGFGHTRYRSHPLEGGGRRALGQGSVRGQRPLVSKADGCRQASVEGTAAADPGRLCRGVRCGRAGGRRRGAGGHAAAPRLDPGRLAGREVTADVVRGIGKMYVDDPRFGANYGGIGGASYLRDAMAVYADQM